MRKPVLFLIVAVLGAMLVLTGCASAGSPTTIPLGQPVTLAPGQSVEITGEGIQLTFLNVVTDSRCPTGAT